MNTTNEQIKKVLDTIIELAYRNEPAENIADYKDFHISITEKELRSKSGHYIAGDRLIEIFNLSLGSHIAVKTCLHELAHHIDQCKNGTTGHKEPFYEEYTKLLYAALNMRILTTEEIDIDSFHNDSNKVKRIVKNWIPEYVETRESKNIILYVKDGYYVATLLKEHGYVRELNNKMWHKEVSAENQEEEIQFLNSIHAEYDIGSLTSATLQKYGYIIATGATCEVEEELKREGFSFQRVNYSSVWKKKVSVKEYSSTLKNLHLQKHFKHVKFIFLKEDL